MTQFESLNHDDMVEPPSHFWSRVLFYGEDSYRVGDFLQALGKAIEEFELERIKSFDSEVSRKETLTGLECQVMRSRGYWQPEPGKTRLALEFCSDNPGSISQKDDLFDKTKFKSLDRDDVIKITDKTFTTVYATHAFRVSDLISKFEGAIEKSREKYLHKRGGVIVICNPSSSWLSNGVDCRVMKIGSGWHKGTVRIGLEFLPDEEPAPRSRIAKMKVENRKWEAH